MTASSAMDDSVACPWMRSIDSLTSRWRRYGRKRKKLGRVAEEVRTGMGR